MDDSIGEVEEKAGIEEKEDSLQEPNPLEFWVAYLQDGDKKNYLSDGKGHLRVYKTEGTLREYLKANLSPETYAMIVVHPVQGTIAVPEDGVQQIRLTEPANIPNPIPISTLAPLTVPTASEQLDDLLKRRKIRRRR
jgi:ubiquinone biosynthesis protein COQ9